MTAEGSVDCATQAGGCVLVTPAWCVTPLTGGGQRTGIIFSALKRLGPTRVITIGKNVDLGLMEQSFPGHAGIYPVEFQLFAEGIQDRRERMAYRIEKFLSFRHEYSGKDEISSQVQKVLDEIRQEAGPGHKPVAVYRYMPPFCWAGHDEHDGQQTVIGVDVDDRDDRARLLFLKDKLRYAPLVALYRDVVLRRLRSMLRKALGRASLVWFTAPEDLKGMEGLPASVIPNVPFQEPDPSALSLPSSQMDLLFVGSLDFPPNSDGLRWFLENCWPQLHARWPESRIRIVGSGTPSGGIEAFRDADGVEFLGRVDDLDAEYARSRLVIAPIFVGGGSKIKVIEACAYGRPVVTTSHSSRGFGAEIEALLPACDSPDAFVSRCAEFLENEGQADAIGSQLRTLQQSHFSREAVEQSIVGQIQAALAETAPQA